MVERVARFDLFVSWVMAAGLRMSKARRLLTPIVRDLALKVAGSDGDGNGSGVLNPSTWSFK
ncbi:hypothetical protein Droror1_Dr00026968, partial [Drosera rotundifolia]